MPEAIRIVLTYVLPALQDALFALLAAYGILLYRRRKKAGSVRSVWLSPVLLWSGAGCGECFCAIVTGIGWNGGEPLIAWCVFEVLALLSMSMLLAYRNESVDYDERGFLAKNMFGVRRSFSYGEITGISFKNGGTFLYCGNRKVRLDNLSVGSDRFVETADRQFSERYGKPIPEHVSRMDPMRGNLDTPWFYLFLWLFVLAGSLFFIVLGVLGLRPADGHLPGDAFDVRTSFQSFEQRKESEGTLVLHADGFEKPFELSYLSGFEKALPEPEKLCDGTVYLVTVAERARAFQINAVSTNDGQPVLSAYDCNVAYRNTQTVPSVILAALFTLGIPVSVLGILVGRYPERFPEPVKKLFYQSEAWSSSVNREPRKRRGNTNKNRKRKR